MDADNHHVDGFVDLRCEIKAALDIVHLDLGAYQRACGPLMLLTSAANSFKQSPLVFYANVH